ncbi:MAG: sulfite reductase subunit A, partial [Ignavibacteriales bacterium]|nr:sulfite reductase subunit A [Ignavibacteriales bacterium]
MNTIEQTFSPTVVVERSNFDALIAALTKRGYHVVGPTIREGNIVYDSIKESSSLPIGWSEEQTAGDYHLVEHTDKTLFGFSSTSQSWKKFLHPPFTQLWKSKRSNARLTITTEQIQSRRFAFLGVRGCDLKAIAVLDKVFIDSPYTDKGYQARRSNTFIIAVNCSQAGGTCFCTSMGTGPKVTNGFDLVLTEVLEKDRHYFVMEAGTKLGLEIL